MAWDDPPIDDGLNAEEGARLAALEAARQEGREEMRRAVLEANKRGELCWRNSVLLDTKLRQLAPGGVEAGERDPIAEALHNHGMGQADGYASALADVEREVLRCPEEPTFSITARLRGGARG